MSAKGQNKKSKRPSKGTRLGWESVKKVSSVKITSAMVKGQAVTISFSDNNPYIAPNFLVP